MVLLGSSWRERYGGLVGVVIAIIGLGFISWSASDPEQAMIGVRIARFLVGLGIIGLGVWIGVGWRRK
jgi:hypothetical protein